MQVRLHARLRARVEGATVLADSRVAMSRVVHCALCGVPLGLSCAYMRAFLSRETNTEAGILIVPLRAESGVC